MFKLLIVDDDPAIPGMLQPGLNELNVTVLTAGTADQAVRAIEDHRPDAMLLDIGLPDLSGLVLFQRIQQADRRLPVVLMTSHGTVETAITAMSLGAYDYVLKPFSYSRVKDLLLRALQIGRSMNVSVSLPDEHTDLGGDRLVGRSPEMQEVYKMIGRIAFQEGIVLVRGASGTGKELVARAIYQHSRRANAPYLAISCAAIPEPLLESELFGHEKGAFTSADRKRIGKFEQCNGGTLFLDEIGDMPLLTQAKVLRVLQEQQFERVGGTETIRTNVRLIAATHCDLEGMVAAGQFRQDLYYRLAVFTITLPPLCERLEDLPLLVQHFLQRFNQEMGRSVERVEAETLDILRRYPWPGNIRELQSVLRQSLLRAVGPVLCPDFLPAGVREANPGPAETAAKTGVATDWDVFIAERLRQGTTGLYAEWFARMEQQLLTRVLRHTYGNQSRAAAALGITRRTLRNKLHTLGLSIERSIQSGQNTAEPPDNSDE